MSQELIPSVENSSGGQQEGISDLTQEALRAIDQAIQMIKESCDLKRKVVSARNSSHPQTDQLYQELGLLEECRQALEDLRELECKKLEGAQEGENSQLATKIMARNQQLLQELGVIDDNEVKLLKIYQCIFEQNSDKQWDSIWTNAYIMRKMERKSRLGGYLIFLDMKQFGLMEQSKEGAVPDEEFFSEDSNEIQKLDEISPRAAAREGASIDTEYEDIKQEMLRIIDLACDLKDGEKNKEEAIQRYKADSDTQTPSWKNFCTIVAEAIRLEDNDDPSDQYRHGDMGSIKCLITQMAYQVKDLCQFKGSELLISLWRSQIDDIKLDNTLGLINVDQIAKVSELLKEKRALIDYLRKIEDVKVRRLHVYEILAEQNETIKNALLLFENAIDEVEKDSSFRIALLKLYAQIKEAQKDNGNIEPAQNKGVIDQVRRTLRLMRVVVNDPVLASLQVQQVVTDSKSYHIRRYHDESKGLSTSFLAQRIALVAINQAVIGMQNKKFNEEFKKELNQEFETLGRDIVLFSINQAIADTENEKLKTALTDLHEFECKRLRVAWEAGNFQLLVELADQNQRLLQKLSAIDGDNAKLLQVYRSLIYQAARAAFKTDNSAYYAFTNLWNDFKQLDEAQTDERYSKLKALLKALDAIDDNDIKLLKVYRYRLEYAPLEYDKEKRIRSQSMVVWDVVQIIGKNTWLSECLEELSRRRRFGKELSDVERDGIKQEMLRIIDLACDLKDGEKNKEEAIQRYKADADTQTPSWKNVRTIVAEAIRLKKDAQFYQIIVIEDVRDLVQTLVQDVNIGEDIEGSIVQILLPRKPPKTLPLLDRIAQASEILKEARKLLEPLNKIKDLNVRSLAACQLIIANHKDNINKIIALFRRAIDRLGESSFKTGLLHLHAEMLKECPKGNKQLKAKVAQEMVGQVRQALTLMTAMVDDEVEPQDKSKAVDTFHKALKQSTSLGKTILKAAAVVAITALCMVSGAAIGFGFGAAVGAWAGPLSFFTAMVGLAGGAAKGVAGGIAVAGVVGLGVSAKGFFGKSGRQKAVSEVEEGARENLQLKKLG